jgi:hypothetical protein
VLLAGGRVKVNTTKFQNDMSKDLLQATLNGDEEAVAHGTDLAHDENTSILSYNNENSLACVLDKTEHVPPLKTVKSVQFWSWKRPQKGLKNGAYPFNLAKIDRKTE